MLQMKIPEEESSIVITVTIASPAAPRRAVLAVAMLADLAGSHTAITRPAKRAFLNQDAVLLCGPTTPIVVPRQKLPVVDRRRAV
jgi:hypothetical protein